MGAAPPGAARVADLRASFREQGWSERLIRAQLSAGAGVSLQVAEHLVGSGAGAEHLAAEPPSPPRLRLVITPSAPPLGACKPAPAMCPSRRGQGQLARSVPLPVPQAVKQGAMDGAERPGARRRPPAAARSAALLVAALVLLLGPAPAAGACLPPTVQASSELQCSEFCSQRAPEGMAASSQLSPRAYRHGQLGLHLACGECGSVAAIALHCSRHNLLPLPADPFQHPILRSCCSPGWSGQPLLCVHLHARTQLAAAAAAQPPGHFAAAATPAASAAQMRQHRKHAAAGGGHNQR